MPLTKEQRERLTEIARLCVVAEGNAFDGLTLYGPFPDPDAAIEWAREHIKRGWRVVPICPTEPPQPLED